jgi:hypothetical protein
MSPRWKRKWGRRVPYGDRMRCTFAASPSTKRLIDRCSKAGYTLACHVTCPRGHKPHLNTPRRHMNIKGKTYPICMHEVGEMDKLWLSFHRLVQSSTYARLDIVRNSHLIRTERQWFTARRELHQYVQWTFMTWQFPDGRHEEAVPALPIHQGPPSPGRLVIVGSNIE